MNNVYTDSLLRFTLIPSQRLRDREVFQLKDFWLLKFLVKYYFKIQLYAVNALQLYAVMINQ